MRLSQVMSAAGPRQTDPGSVVCCTKQVFDMGNICNNGRIMHLSVAGILSALCSLAVCSCGRSDKAVRNEPEPVTVRVKTLEKTDNVDSRTYVGTVKASRSATISCRYSGSLESLRVRQGDRVSEGDVIAVVNSQTVKSMLDMAEATLAQAQDGYDRAKTVHESGSIADVKWIDVQTSLAKARASADAARAAYDDCTLKAPYSGVIGEVFVDEGVDVGVAEPVARLVDISSVEIDISVPESEISGISEGDIVSVSVPALGGVCFRGSVSAKGISASFLSHSYGCTVRPERDIKGLMPGMVCKVSIDRGDCGVVIPASVVKTDIRYMNGKGEDESVKYVWTVDDGKVVKTEIKTGGFSGDGVLVLSGLKEGDTIIVGGTQKVSSGMPVKTVE